MVTLRGGSGETIEDAVLIHGAHNSALIEEAQCKWLAKRLGVLNRHWRMRGHDLIDEGGRLYEKMVVALPDGTRKAFFFDVTEVTAGVGSR